ncbi:MAG: hypothetical protein GEU26_10205 [Nitrososphaeraceae archaeon]|nr:hypothetical protein [Nitrososphaeraceae archaeon]
MSESSKGYKFKIEFEMPNEPEPVKVPDGPVEGFLNSMTRITSFGDTPKEAVDGHFEIMKVWESSLDKQARRQSYRDKKGLK